nr:MCP four helix bundle domain-containing protein [Rhodoferax sp.]
MNIFSDMKIGTRLGLAFGAVLLITALISGMGIWRLNTLKVASEELATVELERNSLAQSWTANINLNWVRTSAALHAADLAEVTVLQKDMTETSKKISESQKRMVTLIQDEKGKELMADIGKKRELYSGPRADLLKRKLAGDNVAADSDRSLRPLAEDYLKAMAKLEQHMDERLAQSQAQAAAIASTSQMAIGGGAVLAAVLGLLFAVLATRSITVPMQRAIASAETITQGNLSASLETSGKDETGQLLKALSDMKDNLARIVGDVRQNAHGVATASAEIAQGNHDLSARTEQQASALEETASSMEELSATVKQNAD